MARASARIRLRTLIAVAVVVISLVAVVAAMRWGPLRNPPPALQLMAHDPLVGLGPTARLAPPPWADTSRRGAIRLPLLLAIRNTGSRPAVATGIRVAAPWQIRLESAEGTPLPMEAEGGNPLLHYTIPLDSGLTVPAGAFGVVIPGFERLWVRPVASALTCTLDAAGVPVFSPAAPLDPSLLARPTLYWTIHEEDVRRRSSGVLTLELDSRWFAVPPAPRPPDFPPLPLDDTTSLPDLSTLPSAGHRYLLCGEAIEPVTVGSTVHRTSDDGSIVALSVDGVTRKLLFDLNGDSLIEAEAWSSAGGRIDLARRTRFEIPDYLLPLPPPPEAPVVTDSAAMGDTVFRSSADTVPAARPDTAGPGRADTTRTPADSGGSGR